MTIDLTFTEYFAPLLLVLVCFIIIFISLKKLSIPGNDFTLAILSFLVSLILVSSTPITTYINQLIPILLMLAIVSFMLMILLVFLTKDLEPFKKPMAWVGVILFVVIALAIAFNDFPVLNDFLPDSGTSHIDSNMEEFKDFIYSRSFRDSLVFVISIVVVGFFMLKKAGK